MAGIDQATVPFGKVNESVSNVLPAADRDLFSDDFQAAVREANGGRRPPDPTMTGAQQASPQQNKFDELYAQVLRETDGTLLRPDAGEPAVAPNSQTSSMGRPMRLDELHAMGNNDKPPEQPHPQQQQHSSESEDKSDIEEILDQFSEGKGSDNDDF